VNGFPKLKIPLTKKYSLLFIYKIFIRKNHKWFGKRIIIVHLLKNNFTYKWTYIPLWKARVKTK
jgi:hypothetical protein